MRDQLIVGLLWVGLTVAGEVLVERGLAALPVVASVEGRVVDASFATLLRVLVPVFTFVLVLLVYPAVRFREGRRGGRATGVRDHRLFSWGWVAVTVALNVLLVVHPGVTGLNAIRGRSDPDLVVEVRAKQWSWSFRYPEHGVQVKDVLVLPAGKRVRFDITSEEVLHSFWVPAFRLKMDAVPGRVTTLRLTPDREISTRDDVNVRVQCAELCGTGHATMRAAVRVVAQEDFDRWIASRRGDS